MNGIDKITQRIGADTQAEIDRILADAAAQAEAAADKFRTQAEAEDRDLLAKSERTAAEREERLVSAAQMEARKTLLTAKHGRSLPPPRPAQRRNQRTEKRNFGSRTAG